MDPSPWKCKIIPYSEAKKDGNDLLFMICGKKCGELPKKHF
jgi:hypothetical protein